MEILAYVAVVFMGGVLGNTVMGGVLGAVVGAVFTATVLALLVAGTISRDNDAARHEQPSGYDETPDY